MAIKHSMQVVLFLFLFCCCCCCCGNLRQFGSCLFLLWWLKTISSGCFDTWLTKKPLFGRTWTLVVLFILAYFGYRKLWNFMNVLISLYCWFWVVYNSCGKVWFQVTHSWMMERTKSGIIIIFLSSVQLCVDLMYNFRFQVTQSWVLDGNVNNFCHSFDPIHMGFV